MTKVKFALLTLLLITGCTPPSSQVTCEKISKMTNDEIIYETHKCESAGLNAQSLKCGNDHTTIRIQCIPRQHSNVDT